MNIHNCCLFSGTTASDTHFQAYLLDGLKRWNDDRMNQQSDKPSTISYSGLERYAVNELSQSVLNERLIPEFRPPRKNTGEKIGVEYLLSQTGKVFQDIISSTDTDNAALARQEEAEAATEEEEEDQDEGFGDDPEDDPTLPSLEPEELRPPQQQTGQRAPVERKQSTGQRALLKGSSPPVNVTLLKGSSQKVNVSLLQDSSHHQSVGQNQHPKPPPV